MGFFDFLLGRKSSPDDAAPGSPAASPPVSGPLPWTARLDQARRESDFDWTWGNATAHRLVHGVLEEARPLFSGEDRQAQIKEIPDDENIDLRGTYAGAPIRFAVWMSFGNFWTIEMRMPDWNGSLNLERDHEKIPKHGDADDPFAEDEGLRIFLAKGVFVEGDEAEVKATLELWEKIPDDARDRILEGMERLDVRNLYATGNAIRLNQRPGLPDLDDPVGYMESCAAYLARVKDAVVALGPTASAVDGGPSFPAPPVTTHRVTCTYCSSRFLQTLAHQNCPNCGAAPRG